MASAIVSKSYAAAGSPNMLYNSSFEITTNPDVPDGWSRDYALPPWGYQAYSVDAGNAFHGTKSVRLGYNGKYVRSWYRHTKMAIGHKYVFSVYLKSDRNNVKVVLDLENVGYKAIAANTEWKRFFVAGAAKTSETVATIHLKSDGALWVDAAQLEEGAYPSDYIPSDSDYEDYDTILKRQYDKLYAIARKNNGYSLTRRETRKENAFELVGTEYDFYTQDNIVRVRCLTPERVKGRKPVKLEWYLERDGYQIGTQREIVLQPGRNDWNFDIHDLPYGEYIVKTKYIEDQSTSIEKSSKFRKLPANVHEVRINRWGRFLVVNGEPFFLYGFYDNLSHGGTDRWKSVLREMENVGTSGMINYIGGIREYEMLGWALDEAQKSNQKVFVHLGWMLSYFLPKYANRKDRFSNEDEAMAKLREVVLKYRQHPALLGWATLDEPDNRPNIFSKEYVERYYRLIKELDPYHPCIISHLTMLGESKRYVGATDIAVIPHSDQSYYDDLFTEYWDMGIPVFTNSACIGALGISRREPTPAEQRVRLYKAIIMGARGLCTYTFRPNSMNTWKEFSVIGRELKTLAPILLSPGDHCYLSNAFTNHSVVKGLLKSYEGRYYIIAVNSKRDAEKVRFDLKDVKDASNIEAMFNSPAPSFEPGEKNIEFIMPGQSVAIYQIF
ncbi:MAG: hypothetical protein FJ117_18230 [Deltaproteobacteria bacterium]|nr:hypothetical protein [Deltaproteobacteria bacterium]